MLRFSSPRWAACALVLSGSSLVADVRDANACGGCFHPPPGPLEVESSVVTDHRMAFSLSPTQTVLWDQIRYTGSPTDFAWVLPVHAGARIELSHDEWIAALDASTQTVVTGPVRSCGGAPPPENTGGGFGCGASPESVPAAESGDVLADAGGDQVQVISNQVVGPYDAVTLRSSQGEALGAWLTANGYEIPPSIQPTIDAYTNAGFDFIALKLAPQQGVQAMQPVRVVSPGADPTLPLRMVAAGIGAHVGLELYVLSEGRYHPANFPDATVDFGALAWDPTSSRSNYAELSQQALAANGGTGWLTESSQPALVASPGAFNPSLSTSYLVSCRELVFVPSCRSDAGAAAADDGGPAGGDDGGAACPPNMTAACDDLSVAMTGMASGDLWVTRLRADLPSAALSQDLSLEATASQAPVSNLHHTDAYTIANYDPCASVSTKAVMLGSGSGARSATNDGAAAGGCRTANSRRDRSDLVVWFAAAAALTLSLRRRGSGRVRARR